MVCFFCIDAVRGWRAESGSQGAASHGLLSLTLLSLLSNSGSKILKDLETFLNNFSHGIRHVFGPDPARKEVTSRSPGQHRTQPGAGQLHGGGFVWLYLEALFHLSCLGLCWHRTRPKIGQLETAQKQPL